MQARERAPDSSRLMQDVPKTVEDADESQFANRVDATDVGVESLSQATKTQASPGINVDFVKVALGLILLLALMLRVYGTDWDQGGLFHPDERDFLGRAERLDFSQLSEPGLFSRDSRLNPAWFNYGSLPLYTLAFVKAIAAPFTERDWNVFDLRFPGRNLTAISDTATVFFVYLLATTLWADRRAGLIAALLAALAVIHIQNAHYTAVDAPMTMFITATIYFSTRLVQEPRTRYAVLTGAMFGLALATKFSAAPVGIAIASAYLLLLLKPGTTDNRLFAGTVTKYALISAATVIAILLVAQPFMFIDRETYVGHILTQSEMVRRIADFPFTRQYIDTTPYLYQFRQLSTWGLGIALGVSVWIATIWAIGRTIVCRQLFLLVPLSFLVVYLLLNGQFDVKFLRYMLPVVPVLLAFTGGMVWWAYRYFLPNVHRVVRFGAYAIGALAFLLTVHYSLAYLNVFRGDHPAQEISQWLRDNAETGDVIIKEHWEEGIPNVPGLQMHGNELPMYESDGIAKFDRVADLMERGDYLVLYSNRLAATIPRLPERYPISTRFYELLFNGGLGYEVVHTSVRVPQFLGITYWDDPYARVDFALPEGYRKPEASLYSWDWYGWADESFTVYEHPHAILFKNVEELDRAEIFEVLDIDNSIADSLRVIDEIGLIYSEADAQIQRNGDNWNEIYFLRNLPNGAAWLVWLIAVQVIALLALPLTYVVFRPFPDRGYLFSKPIGLLLVATLAWLMASTGILGFSAFSVALSIFLLALVSGTIFWKLREEMLYFLKGHLKTIGIAEAIFIVAFFGFFAVRLANPDLWHAWRGGEKPMDFAYLNAITRSTIMPPYDPWFAGGYLNYYYYGQFIVSTLIRITGIIPTVAYNLAIPLIFALTAGSVYTVAYNIVAMAQRVNGFTPRTTSRGFVSLSPKPIVFGIVAAILTVIAGNIDGLIQVVSAFYDAFITGQDIRDFDYWRSTRVFDGSLGGNEITEFPSFTFLYADLHAHMIALPFAMLALGLSISAFMRAGMERLLRVEAVASLGLLGIAIGSLRLINSWDFPTQLLIAFALIFTGEVLFGHRGPKWGFVHALVKSGFVAMIGYVVYLPFHQNFELFNSSVELSKFQTSLWRYLLIHSIFVFAIASWIVMEWHRGTLRLGATIDIATEQYGYPKWSIPVAFASLGLAMAAFMYAYPHYVTVAVTLAAAGIVGLTALLAYLRRHREQRYILIAATLVMMSLFIAAGVDVITVSNDIGRQNTIFKFYIQAWWLLAIAASFAIWKLWEARAFDIRNLTRLRAVWLATFVVLGVGVLVYPVMSTEFRMDERFNVIGPGVDGEAYMDHAVYRHQGITLELATDRAGINWLRNNVEGSPVIVEGQWDLYTWANRIAIYTGLPTIVGWDWHQTQQRHDYRWAVQQRRNDVNEFYTTGDPLRAKRFLDEHRVKYVYVGQLERNRYPASGIEKFETSSILNLQPVFEDGVVTIYEYRG